ncbi:RAMP superfamily CRISPR-associated protein [Desulfurispirillum indicum]|uniref:RAMP superfamily CRISPR-associated protein n=1 Tax=Desulfurispirillum indicum TaxID=936456 RepID=UPI001CF9BDD3|nr:RAMP superfamily CRISPR-associated protein [Desulfurispirillum indicum]UCZ57702.1 RAMP superfamily CRISPR-associated protein [Desulfurispirillum indicum]
MLMVQVTFFSDWHCGSGTTGGADLDLLVIKDMNGLPILPGKTLKGLLREAAQLLQTSSDSGQHMVDSLFGTPETAGALHVENAVLSRQEAEQIVREGTASFLYRRVSATAIGENGLAKDKTLRSFEVTVPMSLFAPMTLAGEMDAEKVAFLQRCAALVHSAGLGRNRGFGACRIAISGGAA